VKAGYKLSKSTFIRGLQCEKSLYLYKHHYKLKDPVSPSLQAVFKRGNNVGILAQQLFPNGKDASPENHFKVFESVGKTIDFINQGEDVIYEATFVFNEVLCALDILVKDKDGWKAYEVKSSTKVSDTYIKDAAIQYHTIVNSGIDLKDISIVHINNQYVKGDELDINKLFIIESVKDRVEEFLPGIPNKVSKLKDVIKGSSVPKVDIGSHCFEPYECDFKGQCWKHIPEYSVFNISNLGKKKMFELYQKGTITLDQIDIQQSTLNEKQILQVKSEINREPYINKPKIKSFINDLKYPLYFLDYETINPAIPVLKGTRPYQQLVFQYSLHIKTSADSEVIHKEYLADSKSDPRIEIVKNLISDCGQDGDIIVYNIGFERSKTNDLLELFPDYSSELEGIVNRLKDLMIPFKKKWYYIPEMKGKYSIKNVLPALIPDMSYDDLNIKEGGTASNTFESMQQGTFDGKEKETRRHLLEYCERDTYSMVKILEKLQQL
jgi:hypothetical protein